ncbi:hypothetical protein [Aquitalea sp. ASV11]|uniref:hypothetical protein n=1 Tax=Aquitalea sp. ASV11 TaxID=2795103 RepID=UPI0018EB5482|nr:hypothetical protein [Aquitalea sp. ASV11]
MPMKYLLDGELINIPDDVLVKIKKIINHDAMRLYKREATEEEFLECLPYTLKTFGLMIQLASEVAPRINLAKKYIEAQNSMSRSDYIQFEKDNPLPPGLSLTISAINSDEAERENITKRQKSAASRPRPKKNIYGKTLNELIISYYKNNLDMTLAELWESFKPELER